MGGREEGSGRRGQLKDGKWRDLSFSGVDWNVCGEKVVARRLIRKWVAFGLAVTSVDQFLFVCLSWLLFSDLNGETASLVLTFISLLRLLGLLLSPMVSHHCNPIGAAHVGLLGRLLAFSLILITAQFRAPSYVVLGALGIFALSDGVFIPASALILRRLSQDNNYLSALALMQVALNLSLALAALSGGFALAYLSKNAVALLLFTASLATCLYFKMTFCEIGAADVSSVREKLEIGPVIRRLFGSFSTITPILQIVIIELVLSGVLNVVLPSSFAANGFGSINFSIAVALFVVGGTLGAACFYRVPRMSKVKVFHPGVLLLLAFAFILLAQVSLCSYFLAFFMLGLAGSLIAPFLTDQIISRAKESDEPAYFSLLSLISYGAIFISYAVWGMLLVRVTIQALFFGCASLFALYGVLVAARSSLCRPIGSCDS